MKKVIYYFGFGTNKDKDMMAHMVGNDKLEGEHGRLIGFELCTQKPAQFRTEIPITSPLYTEGISPRDLITKAWGSDFDMFVSRKNTTGITHGTIWKLTPEEFELVSEWEMVPLGCQENVKGIAVTDDGKLVEVWTQSFANPPEAEVDKIITGDNYEPYVANKKDMLRVADEVREEYLKSKKEK